MPSRENSGDSRSETAPWLRVVQAWLGPMRACPDLQASGVSLAGSETATLVEDHAGKLPALPKLPTVEEFVKQTTTPSPWHNALLQKLKVPGIGKRSKPLQKVDDGLGAYSVNYKQYNDLAARHADMVKAEADPTALAAVRKRAERVFVMATHDSNAVRSAQATWQQDKKQSPLVENSSDATLSDALRDAEQVFRNGRSELFALRQAHSGLDERPFLPDRHATLRFAEPGLARITNTNYSAPQPLKEAGGTLQNSRSDLAPSTSPSQAYSGPGKQSRPPNKLTKTPRVTSEDGAPKKQAQRRKGSTRPICSGQNRPRWRV